jgi:hypothetical protein
VLVVKSRNFTDKNFRGYVKNICSVFYSKPFYRVREIKFINNRFWKIKTLEFAVDPIERVIYNFPGCGLIISVSLKPNRKMIVKQVNPGA